MIDWDRVEELRDEIGPDDFEEVVELFLCEVEERMELVSSKKAISELGEDLHFLKGSALNLGFEQFAKICGDGERQAAQGIAPDSVQGIETAYQTSKKAFLERLGKGAAL